MSWSEIDEMLGIVMIDAGHALKKQVVLFCIFSVYMNLLHNNTNQLPGIIASRASTPSIEIFHLVLKSPLLIGQKFQAWAFLSKLQPHLFLQFRYLITENMNNKTCFCIHWSSQLNRQKMSARSRANQGFCNLNPRNSFNNKRTLHMGY